ncbi:uncharacterized protein RCC_06479 [Ramularia collo-cygni]|uniref:Uncharacterized protein n=1 Tax=Ramularia collo-cygni TaxID=112498 RepID=A0A2D3UVC3_9PEZI|nr:uncharacterized protein RCC_06479 [Ramularia collo-cygni]CZT20621.1 uncharacterized protein RCC_06479 [Ramularia collo-cygni]
MPIEPKSSRPIPPGMANNTHWNTSPFAFPPNTNVLDSHAMPSEAAARARLAGNAYIDASKNRDREEPYQIIGPAPTSKSGQIFPLQSWVDKLTGKNSKKDEAAEGQVLDGQSVSGESVVKESKGKSDEGGGR